MVQVLVDYLQQDHQATISQIESLLVHGEITYPLLYAILIPGTVLISTDPATGEPCAQKLSAAVPACGALMLNCIGLDAINPPDGNAVPSSQGSQIGDVVRTVQLAAFPGVVKISSLPIYPISYHHDENGLKEALLARAQKWMSFRGVHHVHYRGTAVIASMGKSGYTKYEVNVLRARWPCLCSLT